jgi:hypothetical protein
VEPKEKEKEKQYFSLRNTKKSIVPKCIDSFQSVQGI